MIPVKVRTILELIEDAGGDLLRQADAVRRRICGDEVHLRGLIEFSNACSRNCLYCGLRRDNHRLKRYRMSADEILDAARKVEASGIPTVVLQCGEDERLNTEWMSGVIARIRRECGLTVTLSIGVRSRSFYAACRYAGAERFLLKHETASERLYDRVHPDSRLADRLRAIEQLRELGYQVGGGCLVGLPGQDLASLAHDLVLLEQLDLDMVSISPLVPHPDTPMGGELPGSLDLTLRVLAAARLILGPVHMPAATALDVAVPDGRERALKCGANVIMPNFTPEPYRSLYEIYPGRPPADSVGVARTVLESIGRPVAASRGGSLKRKERGA